MGRGRHAVAGEKPEDEVTAGTQRSSQGRGERWQGPTPPWRPLATVELGWVELNPRTGQPESQSHLRCRTSEGKVRTASLRAHGVWIRGWRFTAPSAIGLECDASTVGLYIARKGFMQRRDGEGLSLVGEHYSQEHSQEHAQEHARARTGACGMSVLGRGAVNLTRGPGASAIEGGSSIALGFPTPLG